MKLARLTLFVALNACVTVHASETFKIDSARSTIAFKVRHLLGTAKGKFSKLSGTIVVDREHPEQSSVIVKIAAASIDTAITKRDEHLREGLFNVAKYPEITFKSRRVKQTGANSGQIVGDLTMHGVTREITLNRSEEHTSELQSRSDLVCRLLLEKKKKKNKSHIVL